MENTKSVLDINQLWENINTQDSNLIKKLNDSFIDTSIMKINLTNYLLKSEGAIKFTDSADIIKLFDLLKHYNNLYNLASESWNWKISDSKLFVQNSISKQDAVSSFYSRYIGLIKKKLIESNVNFNYFEFRLKRFNKTKDIIFVFDLEQFTISNKK